jgi:hypothetical protein
MSALNVAVPVAVMFESLSVAPGQFMSPMDIMADTHEDEIVQEPVTSPPQAAVFEHEPPEPFEPAEPLEPGERLEPPPQLVKDKIETENRTPTETNPSFVMANMIG